MDTGTLARVLAEHWLIAEACACGIACEGWSDHEAHVAEVLSALVAASETQARAEARIEAWEMAASFGTMPGLTWPETLRYHAKHHRAAALSSTDQPGGKR